MNTTWQCRPIAAATSRPERPGIRMSRKARLGWCSANSASAVSPSSASATIASSGHACASFSFRRSRISGSSSAINAVGCLMGQASLRWQSTVADVELSGASGRRMRARNPPGSFSSSSSDAAPPNSSARRSRTLASPMPGRRRHAGETRAGVRDRAHQRPVRGVDRDVDAAAARGGLDAVLDRILDQRDQHSRRHRHRLEVLGERHRPRQPPAEPRLHDAEVGADHACLLPQRGHLVAQRRASRRAGSGSGRRSAAPHPARRARRAAARCPAC